jgi:hypothetical protein
MEFQKLAQKFMKFLPTNAMLIIFCGFFFSTPDQAAFNCGAGHPFQFKPSSLKAFRDTPPLSPAAKEEIRNKAQWLLKKLEFTLQYELPLKPEFVEKIERLVRDARQATLKEIWEYRDQSENGLASLLSKSKQFAFLNEHGITTYAEFLIDPTAYRNVVLNERHALYLILYWHEKIPNPEAQQILREMQALLEPLNRG